MSLRECYLYINFLTSNIVSSCCLLNTVPSSNIIDVFDVNLAAWLNQTSKKPNLIKINWSSWPKSQKPGTLLANSTTFWTLGVTLEANCWYNQHFSCSIDSAVEEATCISLSPAVSSGEAGGRMMGFRIRLRVCSSVYLKKKIKKILVRYVTRCGRKVMRLALLRTV